jgi:hypothetical protein
VEKSLNCSVLCPPYLADIPAPLQNLEGARKQSSGLPETAIIAPVFSTGCGKYFFMEYPALDARLCTRSQVGVMDAFPHIHRPYYHYYNLYT